MQHLPQNATICSDQPKVVGSAGSALVSHSITGDYPLLEKHFEAFDKFLSEAKANGWKTLVHCQAGKGLARMARIILEPLGVPLGATMV